MSKFTIFHGEGEDGTEGFWYTYGDGKRSPLFRSFEALLEELMPAFNFQREHNMSASILYGPDEGIVFLMHPDGGLFHLGSVSYAQQEKLWNSLRREPDEVS